MKYVVHCSKNHVGKCVRITYLEQIVVKRVHFDPLIMGLGQC